MLVGFQLLLDQPSCSPQSGSLYLNTHACENLATREKSMIAVFEMRILTTPRPRIETQSQNSRLIC